MRSECPSARLTASALACRLASFLSRWSSDFLRQLLDIKTDSAKQRLRGGERWQDVWVVRVDGNELELLAQGWRLRLAIQDLRASMWRTVQQNAKESGMSADEYLYQWCRTQNSSDVSIDELLPQFLSSLKTIARVVRPVR